MFSTWCSSIWGVVICSSEQGVHTQETVPAFAESKCTNRTGPARSHQNQCTAHAFSTPQAPLLFLLRDIITAPKGSPRVEGLLCWMTHRNTVEEIRGTKSWTLTQLDKGTKPHYLPQIKTRNWNSRCDLSRSLKNWATEIGTEIFISLSHSSVSQSQDHPSPLALFPREEHVIPIWLPSSSPSCRQQGPSKQEEYQQGWSLKQQRHMSTCLPAGGIWHSWCTSERLPDSYSTLRFHAT